MIVSGEVALDAPRDRVFESVREPRFFASCIEGISDLRELAPTRFSAVMEAQIAFMRPRFNVEVELVRVDAPHEIAGKIEGKPLGLVGRLVATAVMTLEETTPAKTLLRYTVDVALTGKLGGLGQSAFAAKTKHIGEQFGINLRAKFATGTIA